jgi:hypothetical protein
MPRVYTLDEGKKKSLGRRTGAPRKYIPRKRLLGAEHPAVHVPDPFHEESEMASGETYDAGSHGKAEERRPENAH